MKQQVNNYEMDDEDDYEYEERPRTNSREPKKKKGNFWMRLFWKLIKRVVFSPLVVFLIAFFYFNQDLRKGILAALIFVTVLTAATLVWKLITILTSMMTFRIFKVIKKSLDVIIMIITIVIYWLLYSMWSGGNFTF